MTTVLVYNRTTERIERYYLENGDAVTLRAWGEKPGAARIGFGECSGTVLPAFAAA
jgi:fumarylacetoacetase